MHGSHASWKSWEIGKSFFRHGNLRNFQNVLDVKEMSCKFIGSQFLRFGDDCDIIINQRKLLHHDKL